MCNIVQEYSTNTRNLELPQLVAIMVYLGKLLKYVVVDRPSHILATLAGSGIGWLHVFECSLDLSLNVDCIGYSCGSEYVSTSYCSALQLHPDYCVHIVRRRTI